MTKQCLIVAGGTAGHVLPSLEIARSFIEQDYHVHWLGHGEPLERQIDHCQMTYHQVHTRSPRARSLLNFNYWSKLAQDIRTIFRLLKQQRFTFILVTGNFIGIIPGIMSKFFGLPLYVYEQNCRLGQANIILKPLSQKIFWGMHPGYRLKEYEFYTAQPLRKDIVTINQTHRDSNKETPSCQRKTLLILGGSLGAAFFNTRLITLLAQSRFPSHWDIIHLAGSHGHVQAVVQEYEKVSLKACVLGYCQDIAKLYERSDALIARAGALSLAEIIYLQKKALIVPLPSSVGDHQRYNVYSCLNNRQIVYSEQERMTADDIANFLQCSNDSGAPLPQDYIAQLCLTN